MPCRHNAEEGRFRVQGYVRSMAGSRKGGVTKTDMSRFLLCGWGPVQWHFDGESAGSAPPKPPDQKNDANYQACDAQHRQQNASCGATGYDAGALGNEDSLGDWSRKSNAIFTRRWNMKDQLSDSG